LGKVEARWSPQYPIPVPFPCFYRAWARPGDGSLHTGKLWPCLVRSRAVVRHGHGTARKRARSGEIFTVPRHGQRTAWERTTPVESLEAVVGRAEARQWHGTGHESSTDHSAAVPKWLRLWQTRTEAV